MKESELRKFHRNLGIILAAFILLQAGSGLLLSLGELLAPHAASDTYGEHDDEQDKELSGASSSKDSAEHDHEEEHGIAGRIHHKKGAVWHLYRVLVAAGLLFMVFSGVAIFIKVQARMRKTPKK